jgi:aerobic carbon-monoxide dehydrogenase medium subunit
MTLPRFELHAPATVDEATDLLERYGDDAAVYCGGTELLLLMKLGFAEPGHLVDVKGIEELRGLSAKDGTLRIGAATTHRQIERSPVVRERWPALAEMERMVANLRVRHAGTIGGNLCFADPHSDPATFLLAAEATLVCRRGGGTARRIRAADFVRGSYRTGLEPGELLLRVEVPQPPPGSGAAHRKLAFHERPAVTVACLARVESGRVAEARVAVGSVGPVPVRAADAERLLQGLEPATIDAGMLARAAEAAAEAARAVEDANGSVEYKEHLVSVLVRRTFAEALARVAHL